MSQTVHLYAFRIKIADKIYGGQMPARGLIEANAMASRFGAVIDGEIVAEQSANVCAICGGKVTKDLSKPEPIEDDIWPEEV